jgi:hypothetical protein
VLLSRDLSLYFNIDFSKIPASKREQALQQQLLLLSPFNEPQHYAIWQAGRVHLWIWDQSLLQARLPQAMQYKLLPDSALSLAIPLENGERFISGINGCEWQRWRNGQMLDSRWIAEAEPDQSPIQLDLAQRSPIQSADRQLLQQIASASLAAVLLASLLIQIGAWLDLKHQHQKLSDQLVNLEDDNQLKVQARRRALQSRELWLKRQALFNSSQSELITLVGEALPASASLWQRYDFQPGRLQIFLLDPSPDPRDYVKRLDATRRVSNVQVQPEPRNDMVTLQAIPLSGSVSK